MDERSFAEALVQKAGTELLRLKGLGFETGVKHNDWKDTITSVDLGVNAYILDELRRAYPADSIYSEEGGGSAGAEREWVVDPIDGSSNFSRGIPHFAISVGLLVGGEPMCGAIYNPVTRELFSFSQGGGASVNGVPLQVSRITDPRESYALLTAGRKDDVREWGGESYKKLLANFKKTKNLGSSALDICFLAAGRVEALIYGTLTTKDIAPALGLLKEAGGVATTATGEPVQLSKGAQRVYAANNESTLTFVRQLLES